MLESSSQRTTLRMHDNASFEDNILAHLIDLKNAQKKSEEQRLVFESRMVLKMDSFMNNIMLQSQGRSQNRGQTQHLDLCQSSDLARFTEEDFEDLDENFPIILTENVDKLEWDIRQNLEFKFLLVIQSLSSFFE